MRKLFLLPLIIATLGSPTFMQAKSQEPTQDNKQSDLFDIKGTVRSENTKITFVADEGGKSWDVVNPETLKDHVGQHVQVNAHVDSDKGQIHVVSVILL